MPVSLCLRTRLFCRNLLGQRGNAVPNASSPPDAIAATAPLRRRPKNLKLKLGDYLEYTPATGEPKNGAPGKPRATRVERAPRPKKVWCCVLSLAFCFF